MASKFAHRQYVAIAAVLANAKAIGVDEAAVADITWGFADMLARDNSQFDRSRFLAAANGTPSNGRDKAR